MKNKGFTFIELLVVITIIGVIFAAGIVSYTAISKNSRNARRRADLETIRQALEICRSISGYYPNNIYPQATGSIVCTDANATVTLKVTPVDPRPDTTIAGCQSTGQYKYELNNVSGTYTLTAPCAESQIISVENP